MMAPPRAEAIEAVKTCHRIKIQTVMITGDHEITARAVAKEIGIYKEGDIVRSGETLAAMGITGTDVTKDASDLVLSDDNFATILKAIERGRWIYDNIKKYLTYLLRCNITEVAVIGGIVLIKGPDHLPLLAAAILYINLATDGLPALALGIAPPDPDIMHPPPRNPRESVFSPDVKVFILMALLIETPFFYLLFFHDFADIARARTELFFLFIIVALVIALNFRSLRYSVFKVPPHRWLILAIIYQLILVSSLIRVPSIRNSFGILMPTLSDLGIIFGFSIFVFLAMEIAKAMLRKRYYKANQNPGFSP